MKKHYMNPNPNFSPAPRSLFKLIKHQWLQNREIFYTILVADAFFGLMIGLAPDTIGKTIFYALISLHIVAFILVLYGLIQNRGAIRDYLYLQAVWGEIIEYKDNQIGIKVKDEGQSHQFSLKHYTSENPHADDPIDFWLKKGCIPCLYPKDHLEKVRPMTEEEFRLIL